MNEKQLARFLSRINKTDGCWTWIWLRRKTNKSRPHASYNGKVEPAARIVWQMNFGTIPDGMYVCHTCDNPECVRPDHLFLGTPRENMMDCIAKGRHGHGPAEGPKSPRTPRPRKHVPSKQRDLEIIEAVKRGEQQSEVARRFGLSRQRVGQILDWQMDIDSDEARRVILGRLASKKKAIEQLRRRLATLEMEYDQRLKQIEQSAHT